jgi:uncharacterized protein (TIGR01777 family)
MRIIITGGTGFVGSLLIETLERRGDQLLILTRHPKKAQPGSNKTYMAWNPEEEQSIVKEIDGADAVINLAGESIIGRWSHVKKEKILTSRVHSTQIIVNSIKKASVKPKVLINASAVGYYGSRGNESLTEESAAGVGFLTEVCKVWEAHAIRAEDFNVRVVRLRIGIVLDKTGGALKLMIPPFRFGAGGWLGDGNQWMSWIAREDLVRVIIFCLDHSETKGAIHAVAPQPITNKAFSMVLAQVLKRPCLAPVPAFLLKILLGEMSEILLGSQKVLPKRALELGFTFQHPEIRNALETILHDERSL